MDPTPASLPDPSQAPVQSKLNLLAGYFTAIVVGQIANVTISCGFFFAIFMLADHSAPPTASVLLIFGVTPLMGFASVYLGALCLPRPQRPVGSIVLLAINYGFYLVYGLFAEHARAGTFLGHLLMILGGGGAVLWLYLRRNRPAGTARLKS